MPYNGTGTFQRIYSWVTDAANGLFVSSTRTDTDTNDIAAGLTNCVTRDGQSVPTANLPMGGFKLTGLAVGTATTDSARVDNANSYHTCEFRMTLTTGVPVTTSDVTGATTVFVTPYKGINMALYDGTNWHMRTSTEMSIAVPNTTSTMYDLFCFDNSGTPTLELLAWTNDTTRATALTTQNGVLVKTGATTRRYLGSFRTTGVSGQTEDSFAKRFVWNNSNRVARPMRVTEATASWTYTTATVRQANGAAANQLDFIVGFSEDMVMAETLVGVGNSSANISVWSGIGLDSTSSSATGCVGAIVSSGAAGFNVQLRAVYRGFPGVGRHFLSWLELSAATGTTTWISGTAVTGINDKSGIMGTIFG